MKKYFTFLIIGFLFLSCKETDKERVNRMMLEWSGKEIVYPNNMHFISLGRDTNYLPKSDFTIITYIDSIGCTSCKLQLSQWKHLITELDSISNTSVLFFLHSSNKKEVTYLLRQDNFTHPVCMDENDSFNKLNHFPSEMIFQTFLLGKDNKVIAIGNPVHNPQVKELYLKIILGDRVSKKEGKTLTTAVCSNTTFDFGSFDWEQRQKARFTLENTGSGPLVIDDVVTSCGCTSVEYAKEPVRPDKSLDINVVYKADHPEHFNKTIMVYCNAAISPIQLKIQGNAK